MIRGTLRRTVALALVLATAAACTSQDGTITPPGGADWGPCEDVEEVPDAVVECATIQVPADWDDQSNGETLDLAIIRIRADGQENRVGSLVMNPGGPGGSGVEYAPYLASELPDDIMKSFDIVGFDPRGVGRSSPVDCIDDQDKDLINGFSPDPVEQDDFDAFVLLQQGAINDCTAKYGDSLAHFASVQAARDMDAVRIAVGDPQLTYLGYSYGTLLGAIYAQQNGANLRAAVLDGAVDPAEDDVAVSESQAAGFEKAYDAFADWCESDKDKCPLDDAREDLAEILTEADAVPPVLNGREATSGWVLTAVVSALYDEEYWEYLAAALVNMRSGDPELVFLLADSYVGRGEDGTYDNSTEAFNAVNCSDDPTAQTVDEVRALQADWRDKYPLFGAPLAMTLLPCALWTAPRAPYPTGAATGEAPILVVGTTGDPATPYANTGKLAAQLGTGRVLTWEGEGHTAYPKTDCIADAVDAYLLELTVPAEGAVCAAR